MLQKQPSDRFRSMTEVIASLSRIAGSPSANPTVISPPPQPLTTATTTFSAEAVDDPLLSAVPLRLQADVPVIRAFLATISHRYEWLGGNTLRLTTPDIAGAARYEFFALLLTALPDNGHLGTMTFMHHAFPLEEHLAKLDRDARKVVIVLSDSFELGRGVREKILDYRNRLDALVVPVYLGELRKAHRAGKLEPLFMDRLADFQAIPDLYAASGPLADPTRFFGMRHVLDQLVAELEAPDRIVVIHGLPGSGRSSLVRMADYGMASARFVRVPCGELETPALASKIAIALSDGGEVVLAARRARSTFGKGPLVLVLEDADVLLDRVMDPAMTDRAGRELWMTLTELAHAEILSIVATTVRGFRIGQRVHDGRTNSFAADVHTLEVPRLERATVMRLMRDLGAQMNIAIPDVVVDQCSHLSGGNVDVVRRLCSSMLKRHRREAAHHALREVTLIPKDLKNAAAELTALRGTFESLLPWLCGAEQRALVGIAARRPRDATELATRDLSVSDATSAVEDLRGMGLVERDGEREAITIPLLAAWSERHLANRSRSRMLRWFQ
jgi:hypothetical protein